MPRLGRVTGAQPSLPLKDHVAGVHSHLTEIGVDDEAAVRVSYATLGSGGEELILNATGAASGDRIQFSKQLVATDIGVALNDKVRFLAEVVQDAGSSPIRSIRAYVTGLFDGLTKSKQLFDMQPDSRATWGNTVMEPYRGHLLGRVPQQPCLAPPRLVAQRRT